jgi:hypothetical protein
VLEACIGWLLREMLMLLGVITIGIIAYGRERPPPTRSDVARAPVEEPVRA